MESVGVEYEDDPVRIFFRARVRSYFVPIDLGLTALLGGQG